MGYLNPNRSVWTLSSGWWFYVLHSQQSRNRKMRKSLLCGGNIENHVSDMDVKYLFNIVQAGRAKYHSRYYF